MRLVSPGKIGAVAPVLDRAEKEDLNAGLAALLRKAENIASSTLCGLIPCV